MSKEIKCKCETEPERQYDKYGIYCGLMCDPCYNKTYKQFDFDPDYCGESLEAEDY